MQAEQERYKQSNCLTPERVSYRVRRAAAQTMTHELPFRIALAALLGLVAAGGNLLGGYFVVYREWPRRYLQYFLALGAGYMLSVALVEVIPASVQLAGANAL